MMTLGLPSDRELVGKISHENDYEKPSYLDCVKIVNQFCKDGC